MENIFDGCKIGVRHTALSVYVIDGGLKYANVILKRLI